MRLNHVARCIVTVHNGCVKDWEIIADNLSKAGSSLGWVSAIDSEGRTSGLLMHIATTESLSPLTAKSDQRLANCDEQLWLAPSKSLKGIDT